eukprot:59367-Prorocentrum_minimum.AAC.8
MVRALYLISDGAGCALLGDRFTTTASSSAGWAVLSGCRRIEPPAGGPVAGSSSTRTPTAPAAKGSRRRAAARTAGRLRPSPTSLKRTATITPTL